MTKADPHPAPWHIGEYPTDTFFSNQAMYHLPALRSVIISYSQNPNQTSCWFMSIGQTPRGWSKKANSRESLWGRVGPGPAIRDILSKLARCQYPQLMTSDISFFPPQTCFLWSSCPTVSASHWLLHIIWMRGWFVVIWGKCFHPLHRPHRLQQFAFAAAIRQIYCWSGLL